MTSQLQNLGWHLKWDNPDFCGWSVVAAYVIAAACCALTASAWRKMGPDEKRASMIWRLLGLGLLSLGINKQLDLQSLLIAMGRAAASAGGWYDKARLVQIVFSAVFTLTGLAVLGFLWARFRQFFKCNPWAFTGVVVLFLFVLIRAASINHVFQWAGIQQDAAHDDKRWTWVLEIGGSGCLALAAAKAGAQADNG